MTRSYNSSSRIYIMKNSIYKEKFTSTNFVKPLYKVKFAKVTPKLHKTTDRAHLVGDAVNVTNNVSNITFKETQKYSILPGACDDNLCYGIRFKGDMEKEHDKVLSQAFKDSASETQAQKNETHNEETWLRAYPAPIRHDEGISSIVFRFLACQLGITVFIVAWTAVWVAVIHSYEGPNEILVNEQYDKQQLQLVIDLATELRTVTPVSPSWKNLIFKRVAEARRQTLAAAERGARLEPGCYWDLSGTFLFTVYVMTALGFGAPVPQTGAGRCFALLYALLAIPCHIYLMMQASTCVVAHIHHYLKLCHKNINSPSQRRKNSGDNQDNANIGVSRSRKRKRLSHVLAVLTMGHCIPVVSLLYYTMGVAIFGLGRRAETHVSLSVSDLMMFPLQFTTNGGLATVEYHYRLMYALYVEGAMALLTCAWAAARRRSGSSVDRVKQKYRLYTKR